MKIGICCAVEQVYEAAVCGYDYVELAGVSIVEMTTAEIAALAKFLVEAGISCLGLYSYCDESVPIAGTEYNVKNAREYAKRVCLYGDMLNIKHIGIGSPKARMLPKNYDILLAKQQAVEFLTITAEVAKNVNINVLFEPLNHDICNFMTSTRKSVDLIRQVNLPNVNILLDFHHMAVEHEPASIAKSIAPYVKHLHISTPGKDGGEKCFLREDEIGIYSKYINAIRINNGINSISLEAFSTDCFQADAILSLRILKKIINNFI